MNCMLVVSLEKRLCFLLIFVDSIQSHSETGMHKTGRGLSSSNETYASQTALVGTVYPSLFCPLHEKDIAVYA